MPEDRKDLDKRLRILMGQEQVLSEQVMMILPLVSSIGEQMRSHHLKEHPLRDNPLVKDGNTLHQLKSVERIAESLSEQSAILVRLNRREEASRRINHAHVLALGIGADALVVRIEEMKRKLKIGW